MCTGKLYGYDLIRANKVKKLKYVFGVSSLKQIDSIAISDSKSDLPLLEYCRKAVVVCKKKPKWINSWMEVILWN